LIFPQRVPPALKISRLAKSYRLPILRDVNLELAPGEYIAIMGESGTGKSTLLNLIAGLDVPDGGSIEFGGKNLRSLEEDERTRLRREKMGFVFQAFHLLPYLTVSQNVSLPLALNGRGAERQRIFELLRALSLHGFENRYPSELSGGEMQRVAIARALVHRPKLVLADEPTGNLDERSARDMLALLREQIATNEAAGILVTHSAIAAATAERVYVMSSGELHLKTASAAETS
jgi:putative ABC transport system ATP-binding protein